MRWLLAVALVRAQTGAPAAPPGPPRAAPAEASDAASARGRWTLGELAERLREDPEAPFQLLDALRASGGLMGQGEGPSCLTAGPGTLRALGAAAAAWCVPGLRLGMGAAAADAEELQRSPVLSPVALRDTARSLAFMRGSLPRRSPRGEHRLELPGAPTAPPSDQALASGRRGLKRGSEPERAAGSSYAHSAALAEALNGFLGDESFRVRSEHGVYGSPGALLRALASRGHAIELTERVYFANFADLWYDDAGGRKEIATPLYVDTGLELPSGRRLAVPVTHSQLELKVRGGLNADVRVFYGLGEGVRFHGEGITRQAWSGGRTLGAFGAERSAELLDRAVEVGRELAARSREAALPGEGYGPLGVCNDFVAFVTGSAPYPLLRERARFAGAHPLDRLSAALPFDAEAPPDPRRILEHLPFEDPADVPLAGLREDLLELAGRRPRAGMRY